jgi:uncharacterized membrane protein
MTRRVLGALLASVALWPLLPVASHYWPVTLPLERVLTVWFDWHCQREPARTLAVLGVPLAVCARCSGLYFGLGVGALLRWPRLTPRALQLWMLSAAALMLTDVALETRGMHDAWAGVRLLTGLLLAYPVGGALGTRIEALRLKPVAPRLSPERAKVEKGESEPVDHAD